MPRPSPSTASDVSARIRTRKVSNAVSAVASVPQVREHLIAKQREIIARNAGPGRRHRRRRAGHQARSSPPRRWSRCFSPPARTRGPSRRSADLAVDPGATAAVTRDEQLRRRPRRRAADGDGRRRRRDRLHFPQPGRGGRPDRRPGRGTGLASAGRDRQADAARTDDHAGRGAAERLPGRGGVPGGEEARSITGPGGGGRRPPSTSANPPW